jgi:hypothetical protein
MNFRTLVPLFSLVLVIGGCGSHFNGTYAGSVTAVVTPSGGTATPYTYTGSAVLTQKGSDVSGTFTATAADSSAPTISGSLAGNADGTNLTSLILLATKVPSGCSDTLFQAKGSGSVSGTNDSTLSFQLSADLTCSGTATHIVVSPATALTKSGQ